MKLLLAALPLVLFAQATEAQPRVDSSLVRAVEVISGVEKRIASYWDLNDDCTVRKGFNVRIERMPSHGAVRLAKTERAVDEDWMERANSSRRYQAARNCLGRVVPVIAVLYKSRSGYTGPDNLFVVRTNAGRNIESHRELIVTVR